LHEGLPQRTIWAITAPGILLGNEFTLSFSIVDASFILDSIFFHSLPHPALPFSFVTPTSNLGRRISRGAHPSDVTFSPGT
jgi:hypothetical protein